MADQELLIVVRMRDEASAVLAKVASAVGKVGSTSNNALGPTNALTGALANQTSAVKGQTAALQQTASWAGIAKQAFATLSSGIISATSNAAAINNMANAGLNLGRNLGTAGQALGTFGATVRTTLAAGGPLSGQLGAIAGAAGRLAPHIARVAVAYMQLVDAAEPVVAKHDELMRRLSAVAGGRSAAEDFYKGIKAYADKTSISITAATEKAIEFSRAGGDLGLSTRGALRVATTTEQLMQVSGASPQEAAAAHQALLKMLSSAKVEAADLKAILSNVPMIADQIARGLGLSVGELRQMADAGRLAGSQVSDALLRQSGAIKQSYEQLPQSVEKSKQRIANAIDSLIEWHAKLLPGVRLYQWALEKAADAAVALDKATSFEDDEDDLRKKIAVHEVYVAETRKDSRLFAQGRLPKAEAALRNLKERLEEIEKKNMAAFKDDKAKKLEGTINEIAAALGKLGLSFEAKTGAVIETAIRDAQAKVADWTAKRDRVQQEYDDIKLRHQSGQASDDDLSRAKMALDGVKLVLRNATTEFANLISKKREAVDASIAAEKEAIASTNKVTFSLVGFRIGLDGIAAAALDFSRRASLDLASMARTPFDPAEQKPPAWANKAYAFGLDSLTEPLQKPVSGGSGGSFGGGGDKLKPLRDELATIAAAYMAISKGVYEMRKAEMEARASRAGKDEGDLQREVFEARQKLTDATTIANLKDETELMQKLAEAAGDVNKQNQIRLDYEIAKAQRGMAPGSREEFAQAMRDKAEATKKQQEADAAAKEEQGKMERATAFARETFKGFFSDLKDGLKKGQGLWEAFGNAARNALNKITEKIVDLVSNKLMDQLFEGLGNVLGSGGGKGSGASGGGDGGIFGFVGKGLKALASFLFADGGIMTSRGPVPLRKYAGGGIATSPQLAMFGEGSVPEAYVPVPSGRIPVELRGGGMRGGMTVQTNISVNMAAPADGQGSGGRGGNMMEQARELGAIVTAMVNKNLQDQMRPGGLLNPSGSFSAGVVQ